MAEPRDGRRRHEESISEQIVRNDTHGTRAGLAHLGLEERRRVVDLRDAVTSQPLRPHARTERVGSARYHTNHIPTGRAETEHAADGPAAFVVVEEVLDDAEVEHQLMLLVGSKVEEVAVMDTDAQSAA